MSNNHGACHILKVHHSHSHFLEKKAILHHQNTLVTAIRSFALQCQPLSGWFLWQHTGIPRCPLTFLQADKDFSLATVLNFVVYKTGRRRTHQHCWNVTGRHYLPVTPQIALALQYVCFCCSYSYPSQQPPCLRQTTIQWGKHSHLSSFHKQGNWSTVRLIAKDHIPWVYLVRNPRQAVQFQNLSLITRHTPPSRDKCKARESQRVRLKWLLGRVWWQREAPPCLRNWWTWRIASGITIHGPLYLTHPLSLW